MKRTEKSELETSKNGNRIPVIIDGVSYESIAEASRRLGVTRATIETYLRNGKKKPLSGMQKVVIAVVVTIFLAILIIFLIVASYARKTDEISSVKSKVSQISQKKSEDKAHYFDVPKQVSGMTFKALRDYLTAQGVELTKISWHIMPEKYTSAGDYQATLKGLATDDNYSLNNLDGDWTNKKTGKNYDMHTIVAVYQLNNDVRDNRVGMNHVEWQQHKIEIWISPLSLEEQQKKAQSASAAYSKSEVKQSSASKPLGPITPSSQPDKIKEIFVPQESVVYSSLENALKDTDVDGIVKGDGTKLIGENKIFKAEDTNFEDSNGANVYSFKDTDSVVKYIKNDFVLKLSSTSEARTALVYSDAVVYSNIENVLTDRLSISDKKAVGDGTKLINGGQIISLYETGYSDNRGNRGKVYSFTDGDGKLKYIKEGFRFE